MSNPVLKCPLLKTLSTLNCEPKHLNSSVYSTEAA